MPWMPRLRRAVLLGICEPQMTGIGGDCFVLLKPAGEERIVALNGSGRAPAALSAPDMRGRGLTEIPPESIEAVTVPGPVDAFCRLVGGLGKTRARRQPCARDPLRGGGRAGRAARRARLVRRAHRPARRGPETVLPDKRCRCREPGRSSAHAAPGRGSCAVSQSMAARHSMKAR